MNVSEPLGIRVQCVVVDARDPRAQARFWAQALGWRITHDDDDESVLEPPEGSPANDVAPDILFVKVPESEDRQEPAPLRPASRRPGGPRLAVGGARCDPG